jgi:hypothetical protein
MIVKFLSSTPSFSGVEYNTNKMDTGKGELMEVHNFGQLQVISDLRPEDYKNYLKAVSSKSNSIKNPQLHVTLSAKGCELDKFQLTEIALKWMNEMGYGHQPFLIVFHNDTDNNHVHVVSTRVDQETGKKIPHDFERVRAMEAIKRIMGIGDVISSDIKLAQGYNFRTEAQFSLLIEKMGYTIIRDGDTLKINKFGKEQARMTQAEVKQLAKENKVDDKRLSQLKAIVSKYQKVYDAVLKPVYQYLPGGGQGKIIRYQSPLSDHLHLKFGLEAVFHFKDDKPPYGYTLIDNANKNVFKGSEILPLKEFISSKVHVDREWFENSLNELKKDNASLQDLDDILKAKEFERQGYNVFSNDKEVVYTIEKSDIVELINNKKKEFQYSVFSEQDRTTLNDFLNIPNDRIVIDYKNDQKGMYGDLLKAAVYNYPTIEEGLKNMNFSIIGYRGQLYLLDSQSNTFTNVDNLANEETKNIIYKEFSTGKANDQDAGFAVNVEEDLLLELSDYESQKQGDNREYSSGFQFFMASDIDDEAINGRNRRRKKHVRGNSR